MPLVGNPLSSNVNKSGILPRFIEDATRQCCSSCSQKTTTVNWNYDSDGRNALKNSREEVMSAIERLTHISVPFLSKAADLEDIMLNPPGSFDFVPIVVSPGVAQFTRKMSQTMKGNKWGENLILGIRKNLPFYIMACLMTMAAGIILWTLVSYSVKQIPVLKTEERSYCHRTFCFPVQVVILVLTILLHILNMTFFEKLKTLAFLKRHHVESMSQNYKRHSTTKLERFEFIGSLSNQLMSVFHF